MSSEQALYSILEEQIDSDTLLLPTLPEVAIRVREVVDDPDSNIQQVCDVIAQDPALTLRLIRVANATHYARSAKVATLSAALHRIGLRAVKNIAIAMALEQLFICQNPIVKTYMASQWRQSVNVCCAASSLFALYKGGEKPRLTYDSVALMGLVHNIGVLPILAEAERHYDVFANPTFLDKIIAAMSGKIGARIVAAWEFEPDFTLTLSKWFDLSYQPMRADYVDFVRLGALYAKVPFLYPEPDKVLPGFVERGVISDKDIFISEAFSKYFKESKVAFE